jgi:hypothetical protein
MSVRQRLVAALLYIYPFKWRSEYGSELSDLLSKQPLDVAIAADVFWNGLRQRVRSLDPSTVLGLGMMLAVLAELAWNIIAPRPYGEGWTVLLEPSSKTLPTIDVRPLTSEIYFLFLLGSGCWLHLRYDRWPSQSGVAAMRICFIASLPIMLAGVLMLFGVLNVMVAGPGDALTTFHEHGFTYTYYSRDPHPPAPLSILVSALLRLPESWMWGMLGASLGRWISRIQPRLAASS